MAKGSPASKAGAKDGDVLTRIETLDATQWRTDPRLLPLSRFWNQPAGNNLKFSCRRGERIRDFKLELEEIIPMEAPAPPALETGAAR